MCVVNRSWVGILQQGIAVRYSRCTTPVGELLLAGDRSGLRFVLFDRASRPAVVAPGWQYDAAALAPARVQLEEYFAGQRQQFDLPLAPGGTAFQLLVWEQLQTIPYGATTSYGELAARLGKPKASRAVGLANGANPLSIVIPCHRVIGSDGRLTGYGGGLDNKRLLLDLERLDDPTHSQRALF